MPQVYQDATRDRRVREHESLFVLRLAHGERITFSLVMPQAADSCTATVLKWTIALGPMTLPQKAVQK